MTASNNNEQMNNLSINELNNLTPKQKMRYFYDRYQRSGAVGFGTPIPPKLPESLTNVKLEGKQVAQLPLTTLETSVLFGTISGDTSINIDKGYKNARCQCRHSTRQSEWFFWKWITVLGRFCDLSSMLWQASDGYQLASAEKPGELLGKLKVTTRACEELTQVHSIIVTKGKKGFRRSWLNHMTDYFLMTLWLDDGSIHAGGTQGEFALDMHEVADLELFSGYLRTVWGVNNYVVDKKEYTKYGHRRHRINIASPKDLLNLLRIIAPIIPVRSMLYKVYFVSHNDSNLTQRWACELVSLVKDEFKDEVQTFYANLQTQVEDV